MRGDTGAVIDAGNVGVRPRLTPTYGLCGATLLVVALPLLDPLVMTFTA